MSVPMTGRTGIRESVQALFRHEAAGGVVLLMAAAIALILDNSSLAWLYDKLLHTPVVFKIGTLGLDKPLLLWINDGLMAVFFFVVGLEIKREIVEGRLSSAKKAALPVIAALGGMMVPAIIYVAFNHNDPVAVSGWAIPAATDIAFAIGVLALLGSRVPPALKVFLLALAIIDDLGAIVIIALFYTSHLSLGVLAVAAVGLCVLAWLNLRGVQRVAPYVIVGLVIWVCVLKSGVHATLAGVAVALFIPINAGMEDEHRSPLKHLEHMLAPWVAFGVMPVFAFANAGVSLKGLAPADLFASVPLGIAAGLFFGKQIGIFGFIWGSVKLRIAHLPEGASWLQVYGVSVIAGIGFTMSLFIGTLAFADPEHAAAVRIGVLAGSIASGVIGYMILRYALGLSEARREAAPSGAAPVGGSSRA